MSDKEKEKEKEKSSGGGESKPGDLGLLEEDDEFEEFPAEGENFVLSFSTEWGGLSFARFWRE